MAEELERAAAELGVARPPVLLWSAALSVPMTCGFTEPAILLPCAALHWGPARMRVVLLHELAHIRRRDCVVHCLAQAALALHWCNPLMWMALARLRAERERACDDRVLVTGTRGSDYAEHLLDIARQFRRQGIGVAAVAMARPSELEGRLLAILDPLRSRRPAESCPFRVGGCGGRTDRVARLRTASPGTGRHPGQRGGIRPDANDANAVAHRGARTDSHTGTDADAAPAVREDARQPGTFARRCSRCRARR